LGDAVFDSILVPTNGSKSSQKAIQAAVAFAKSNGARLVGIAVSETKQYAPPTGGGSLVDFNVFRENSSARALYNVQKLAVAAAIGGVRCTTHVAESSRPGEAIMDAARKFQCDLIFMAIPKGKRLKRYLGQCQTLRMLEDSAIPVLIFR